MSRKVERALPPGDPIGGNRAPADPQLAIQSGLVRGMPTNAALGIDPSEAASEEGEADAPTADVESPPKPELCGRLGDEIDQVAW